MTELDTILTTATDAGATDVHLNATNYPRIRLDNNLIFPRLSFQFTSETMPKLFEQMLLKLDERERANAIEKHKQGLDLDFAFSSPRGDRVRANVYRSENGISAALRLIPNKRLTMEEIGLPFPMSSVCNTKSGLFIISGATGSGKTTTIAAMLDYINNTRNVHILTIEDPVEYLISSKHSLVSQRQVGLHAPSFYDALRSAVRENPDIIMLGEMRDLETTRTAIELAETGHLVLASLHTRTATSTIDRLVGQFPSNEQRQIRLMLSENLVGVLTQTLLPKVNGGLIAAFELLMANYSIRNLIREEKLPQLYSVIQTGKQQGMITMEDCILSYVERGIISPANALSKAPQRTLLLDMMRKSDKIPDTALKELY